MLAADKHAEILNDLIRINNDRIAGYEKAMAETGTTDMELQTLFKSLVAESVGFRADLMAEVAALNEKIAGDTTTSGKLYRLWMDVKSAVVGTDRKTVLESCAWGEEAWQKAYEAAMVPETHLPEKSHQLLTRQYHAGQQSGDTIKKYRDALAAL